MNPIQTRYKGYHFRSRLEARWAVFFETLGLKWEYEPEGFVLPNGDYYLPDFRVQYPLKDCTERYPQKNAPTFPVWFEVKGDIAKITEAEWRKMASFNDGNLILLDGVPSMRMYLDPSTVVEQPDEHSLEEISKFERYGHSLWSYKQRIWYCQEYESWFLTDSLGSMHDSSEPWFEHLQAACDAARSARFEHGSCGPT